MDKVAWGIIGCGAVTEVKSGPALQQAAGSHLAAVMRRDGAKAQDYARRHGVPRWYDDADRLIADPDVSAIYVATPPNSHREFTLKALAAGKPVLVEKPMALTVDECREMNDAADAAGLPLFVAYYRRCLPRFEWLRTAVQEDVVGRPVGVSVRQLLPPGHQPDGSWRLDPSVGGGGLFADTQSHTLDWLDHAFGPIAHASAMVERGLTAHPAEDLVAFTLRFASGLVGSGFCAYVADRREDLLTIHGTQGELSMPVLGSGPIRWRGGDGGEGAFELSDPPHVHLPMVVRVVRHLRGGPPAPCLGTDGLRTTAVCQRLLGAT